MAFYQSIVDQCYVYGCIWKYCETWNGRDSAAFILSERKCSMELFCLLSEWKCGNVYIRLFGKVYFPRLTVPISNVLCSVIRFGIQMLLVVILLGYYIWKGAVSPHWEALLLIFLLLLWLGCMGMGVGILISSVTTKYRDLSVMVGFGMSLWMYGTPVVYPMSILPEGILKKIILLNPVTAPMEMFRYILLGEGNILPVSIGVSLLFTILVMLGGIVVFNKVERTFMDTV